VPVVGATPDAPVEPSQLSGHAMEAAIKIVLAPGTLAQLRKHVGDTVAVGSGARRTRLVIVGTAALPAVGILTNLHTELATGAVVARPSFRGATGGPWPPLMVPRRFSCDLEATSSRPRRYGP